MIRDKLAGILLACLIFAGPVLAAGKPDDVFRGKLFPPNVIMQHQDELELSREQFTAIRSAVVEVQGSVAEHEWDLREAYRNIATELDKPEADERVVLEFAQAALRAENEVKLKQMRMLIRVRNVLNDEQIEYLKRVTSGD